jgi:hypothetical protein
MERWNYEEIESEENKEACAKKGADLEKRFATILMRFYWREESTSTN